MAMSARALRLPTAFRAAARARPCAATAFAAPAARRRLATAASELARTGLYDFHVAHEAKMVPFAGYSMPLQYGAVGQSAFDTCVQHICAHLRSCAVAAHNHVRTEAGLFDVGHMVQTKYVYVYGPY
jgi:aminomethyltransferase